MFVGKIEARAYSRSTEVEDRVIAAVLNLFPEDLREEVPIVATRTEGQSGDTILVIAAVIEKRVACERMLKELARRLPTDSRQLILDTLDQRLDEDCTLFLRIDKQAAYLGRIETPSGPDVISLRVHLRDYPKCNRDEAIQMLEEILHPEVD